MPSPKPRAMDLTRPAKDILLQLIYQFSGAELIPSRVEFSHARYLDPRPDIKPHPDTYIDAKIDRRYDDRFDGVGGFIYKRLELSERIEGSGPYLVLPQAPFNLYSVLCLVNSQLKTAFTEFDIEDQQYDTNPKHIVLKAKEQAWIWMGQTEIKYKQYIPPMPLVDKTALDGFKKLRLPLKKP